MYERGVGSILLTIVKLYDCFEQFNSKACKLITFTLIDSRWSGRKYNYITEAEKTG